MIYLCYQYYIHVDVLLLDYFQHSRFMVHSCICMVAMRSVYGRYTVGIWSVNGRYTLLYGRLKVHKRSMKSRTVVKGENTTVKGQ